MIRSIPAGETGLLVESGYPAAQLGAAIAGARLDGLADVIPGARTVLVICDLALCSPAWLAEQISGLRVDRRSAQPGPVVEIPVSYDGPDLADVAELTGLSTEQVIAAHAAGEYAVGWLGFSPGFGYLTGLDQRLAGVPRLASPRPAVPAGSVAIAGGLTAVYPAGSPGGWRLIGRTTAAMWDPAREPPALLAPGRRVRFRQVPPWDAAPQVLRAATTLTAASAHPAVSWLEVVRPGPLATVQDLGRPGYGAVGVPPSGAADARSLIAANNLAGNAGGAAAIELTLGRAAFRCAGQVRLATAGAPASITLSRQGAPATDVGFRTVFDAAGGDLVSIGPPASGLRTYLAMAGGVDVPAVLGSRSADLLSGLGGGPLRPGDLLPAGQSAPGDVTLAAAAPAAAIPARGQVTRLRIVPGPRLDWFVADAPGTLCGSVYTVGAASNRTGLRLDGPPLSRATTAELPSEGMVTGSLQVPHDGRPILLLADHPTVGGYPVIAVLVNSDIPAAGQLRPGDQVTFTTP